MIVVSEEVRGGSAVVALETTLIAHGFPAGEGVAVGLESERRVREAGAVPATIGVLDGEIRVGPHGGRAGAVRRRRAQGGAARSRRVRRAGCDRRDDGRRDARGVPSCRHPVHGNRRARRRAPRLSASAGRVRGSRRACSHAGARRFGWNQVAARRPGDARAPRVAGRAGARVPHERVAALLYRARRPGSSGTRGVAGRGRASGPRALGSRRRRSVARAST